MTLHTIVPELLWADQPQMPEAVCVKCRYGYVQGHRDNQGGVVVSRIISTDPAAYLDPAFSPGKTYVPLRSDQNI